MTPGEKLLSLTVEYQAAVESLAPEYATYGGVSSHRNPAEISAEYEEVLTELVARTVKPQPRSGGNPASGRGERLS